jgi:hypothetical protein
MSLLHPRHGSWDSTQVAQSDPDCEQISSSSWKRAATAVSQQQRGKNATPGVSNLPKAEVVVRWSLPEAGLFRVEAVTLDLCAHRLDSLVLSISLLHSLRHRTSCGRKKMLHVHIHNLLHTICLLFFARDERDSLFGGENGGGKRSIPRFLTCLSKQTKQYMHSLLACSQMGGHKH